MGLREKLFKDIKIKNCIIAVLSSTFLAFGLYHVHSLSGVTEGGVIGLNLLLEHLEDNDDVQNVYHNWDMPEEEEED